MVASVTRPAKPALLRPALQETAATAASKTCTAWSAVSSLSRPRATSTPSSPRRAETTAPISASDNEAVS